MESKRFAINSNEERRVVSELKDYFSDNIWKKEIIHSESELLETVVIVLERYFARKNSTVTVTYTIVREEGLVQIIIIASGGRKGVLNFASDALTQIILEAEEKLLALGFEEIK